MSPKLTMQLKGFLKQSFFISLFFSTTIFVFLRLIFSSFPISVMEDGLIFFKTILTGWAMVMAGRLAFEGLVLILEYGQKAIREYIRSLAGVSVIYKEESFSQDLQYAGE